MTPATFTMTQLAFANQTFQVDAQTGGGQGVGYGTVPQPLTITAAGAIYARRRSAADGTTIVQAPWLVTASAAVGTYAAFPITGVAAPAIDSTGLAAVAAQDGWAYLDISGDGQSWTNGTTPIAMGDLTSVAGQSLATCFFNRDGYDTTNTIASVLGSDAYVSDFGRVFVAYDGAVNHYPANPVTAASVASMTWTKPVTGGTYDSTFIVEYLRKMIARTGRIQGVVGYTHSGTAIASWNPALTGNNMALHKAVQATGAPRGWCRELWYQGQSDAQINVSISAYKAALGDGLGLKKASGAAPSTGFSGGNAYAGTVQRLLGCYPNYGPTALFGSGQQADRIRLAGQGFANDNSWTYFNASDVALNSGVHETSALNSSVNFARDLYRAVTSDNIGPALVSASRGTTASGNAKTIAVVMANLGTDFVFTGNWWQRFFVFNAGSRSTWTVSGGAKVDATHLTLTLSSDPGDGQALEIRLNSIMESTADVTGNLLRDNRTDGDGITVGRPHGPYFNPATPTTSAITVAAPGPGGATNAPNTVVAPTSTIDMVMTTPTYSAAGVELVSSFGTYLTAGSGAVTRCSAEYNIGMTMEMFFSISALPTGNATVMSFGGSGAVPHLQLNSAGRLYITGSNGANSDAIGPQLTATAAGDVIATGKVYHVALMVGPHGTTAFCHNVTDGVDFTPITLPNPWPATPKACQYSALSINGSLVKLTTGSASHQAIWSGERWLSGNGPAARHTAPTAPLVGNEVGLVALYRYNGDGTDSVKSA